MPKEQITPEVTPPTKKETSSRLPLIVLSVISIVLIILVVFLSLKLRGVEQEPIQIIVTDEVMEEMLDDMAVSPDEVVDEEDGKEMEEEAVSPFIYVSRKDSGAYFAVDRKTGIEKKVPLAVGESSVFFLLSVPQVNYQGEFFVTQHKASTSDPGHAIVAINAETGDKRVVFEKDEMVGPFVNISSVSPDQRYVIAVVANEQEVEPRGSVLLYDLLNGEVVILGSVGEGEYLTDDREDMFGIGNPEYNWLNRTCVNVGIFGEDRIASGARKFKEYREFCVE